MSTCLVCKKGKVIQKDPTHKWYECTNCGTDSNELVDGFLYPLFRRGTLCSLYTPVHDLQVNIFNAEDIVDFTTTKNSHKRAKVIHVDIKDNKMIIEDVDTKKIRFVVDNKEIADAYDDLFPVNKIAYSGWWNRRIKFIS